MSNSQNFYATVSQKQEIRSEILKIVLKVISSYSWKNIGDIVIKNSDLLKRNLETAFTATINNQTLNHTNSQESIQNYPFESKEIITHTPYQSVSRIIELLNQNNVIITDIANDVLRNDTLKDCLLVKEQALQFRCVSLLDLGIEHRLNFTELHSALMHKNLSLCPKQTAMEILIQKISFEKIQKIIIASMPIRDIVGDHYLFQIEHPKFGGNAAPTLSAQLIGTENRFEPTDHFLVTVASSPFI